MNNHSSKYDLSIIIACYNEEPHLLKNINEIENVMNQTKYSYEFIFVDDCSQDNTKEIIETICSSKNNCKAVFHNANVGRGGSVKEGLLMSDSKYAGFLDIDLEISARYIPYMILTLEKGYELSSINRLYQMQFSIICLIRIIISEVNKQILVFFLKFKSPDPETGYKFFNMETMRHLIEQTKEKEWFWDSEIIHKSEKSQKKIKFIPGVFTKNIGKKSTVKIIPDTIKHIKSIIKMKHIIKNK